MISHSEPLSTTICLRGSFLQGQRVEQESASLGQGLASHRYPVSVCPIEICHIKAQGGLFPSSLIWQTPGKYVSALWRWGLYVHSALLSDAEMVHKHLLSWSHQALFHICRMAPRVTDGPAALWGQGWRPPGPGLIQVYHLRMGIVSIYMLTFLPSQVTWVCYFTQQQKCLNEQDGILPNVQCPQRPGGTLMSPLHSSHSKDFKVWAPLPLQATGRQGGRNQSFP